MIDDPTKPLSQQGIDNDLPVAVGVEGDEEPTDEELDKIAHEQPEDILRRKNSEPNGTDVGLETGIDIHSSTSIPTADILGKTNK